MRCWNWNTKRFSQTVRQGCYKGGCCKIAPTKKWDRLPQKGGAYLIFCCKLKLCHEPTTTWTAYRKGRHSFERRQAILKQFIKEVRVGRDHNIEIVHTLHTTRKGKSTCIRSYKKRSHAGGLSRLQVWSPSLWFSRWCSLGRNIVGGQVSYRPLRCNSHGVQMYRIPIHNKIRCTVKAQLLLLMNGRCSFYIWQQVIDWQAYTYTINFIQYHVN